jgi:hypothetical protein
VVGSYEHGNEPSDSIKGGELLDQIKNINFSRRELLHIVIYFIS